MPVAPATLSWAPFPKAMYGRTDRPEPDPATFSTTDAKALSRLLRHQLRARRLDVVRELAERLLTEGRHRDLAALYLARLSQLAGQFEAALDWLERARAAGLPTATVDGDRGLVLCAAGQAAAGAPLLLRAIAGGMTGHSILVNATQAHREMGRQTALLAILDGLPREAWTLPAVMEARLACLGDLGRSDDARRLLNVDRLMVTRDLGPALTQGLGPAPLDRLRAELLDRPHFIPDPVGHTTRYGQQSQQLLVPPCAATRTLLDLIQQAVPPYLDGLADQQNHPFLWNRPRRARLEAWTVVSGQGGHQMDHIHPGGWLSGVFYVAVPPAPEPADVLEVGPGQDPAGALEIPLPFRDAAPAAPVRRVRPRPGMLLLFPSFYRHRTVPTTTPSPRLCVAFDVVPVR